MSDTYIGLLRSHQLIDFADISIESCKLVVRYPVVRAYIKAHYPWLVIDEYQDLGSVFNYIINVLVDKTDINFFIVGDPNQSIMGFAGASPSYLRSMLKREDVLPIKLQITRRCMPEIVKFANRLAPENDEMDSFSKGIEHNGVKAIHCPGGSHQQIEAILSIVQHEHRQGTPYGQMAILCSNRYGIFNELANHLLVLNISYGSGKDNRYDRTPLTRWLEHLAQWSLGGWKNNHPRFEQLWHQYKRFLQENHLFCNVNELEILERFFHSLWSRRSPDILVRDWLSQLASPESLRLHRLIARMDEGEKYLARSFETLENAVSSGNPLETMTLSDLALCGRSTESIYLSSLHSSKGLEFDVVLIPELEQGILPKRRFLHDEDEIAEARRLLYVGITRARKDAYLLYSGFYESWYKRHNLGPSQFFKEMGFSL